MSVSLCLFHSLSCLLVSDSLRLCASVSLCLCVSASLCLCLSVSFTLRLSPSRCLCVCACVPGCSLGEVVDPPSPPLYSPPQTRVRGVILQQRVCDQRFTLRHKHACVASSSNVCADGGKGVAVALISVSLSFHSRHPPTTRVRRGGRGLQCSVASISVSLFLRDDAAHACLGGG